MAMKTSKDKISELRWYYNIDVPCSIAAKKVGVSRTTANYYYIDFKNDEELRMSKYAKLKESEAGE